MVATLELQVLLVQLVLLELLDPRAHTVQLVLQVLQALLVVRAFKATLEPQELQVLLAPLVSMDLMALPA